MSSGTNTLAALPAVPPRTTASDLLRGAGPSGPWTMRSLFRTYRWRMLFTYALFNLENLVRLAQPLVLGLAINGLLQSSAVGVVLFVVQHLVYMFLGAARRMYDTRAFTGIYTDLATQLVVGQRGRAVELSRVAARSALSREVVDFFERDVPFVVHALYSVFGALVMLALYDGLLVPLCLALLAPLGLLNRVYGRSTFTLNARLNDELEREVEVIGRGGPAEVRSHYRRLAHWRIRLSDWEAVNFGLTEVFVLGLLVAALVRSCLGFSGDAGHIFAVFGYILMFVGGLDGVPMLVQRLGRLRDIGRRMQPQADDGGALPHD